MRIYLKVPYDDRRLAKLKGARWDNRAKKWFIVDRPSFLLCQKWCEHLTPAIRKWVKTPELFESFKPAKDVTTQYIRSQEQERRAAAQQGRRARLSQKRVYSNSMDPRKADRIPANTPSGSSIKISSITVKLPL